MNQLCFNLNQCLIFGINPLLLNQATITTCESVKRNSWCLSANTLNLELMKFNLDFTGFPYVVKILYLWWCSLFKWGVELSLDTYVRSKEYICFLFNLLRFHCNFMGFKECRWLKKSSHLKNVCPIIDCWKIKVINFKEK